MAKTTDTPHRIPLRVSTSSYGSCPICGEKRVTQDIHLNTYTFACGYSGVMNREMTACQGKYFQQFLEMVEESIWEGIW